MNRLETNDMQKHLENEPNNQHLFDHLQGGIWMSESMDDHLIFASKGLADIFEVSLETLYENPYFWKEIILPEYREELLKKYQLLKKGKEFIFQYQIKTGDGKIKWIYEQASPKMNGQGKIINLYGIVIDITDDMNLKKKLDFMTKNDPLTGLPNQRSLDQKLDKLIASDEVAAFALLYIDLDNFSWINDSLGFQIGDLVLPKIANRLLAMLPDNGYLARMNSNEFVVIIQNYRNKENVFQFAEQMIQQVNEQLSIKDYKVHMTTSIGISFYPENGHHKLILMEKARTALDHAKRLGKNNYQLFSNDQGIRSREKYMIEQDLRKAIRHKNFELYYQPQVNPKNGVIEGAEALIRWNHDVWGVVSPEEFIPLAEEKHLIHEIGDWVIQNVCTQLQTWKKAGYELYPISVNISPLRFLRSGLVETVQKQLEIHQIPAKYLILEITESSFFKNKEYIFSILKSLKDIGVKIALDDFGTGFASLDYLHHFEVDILKIDQMFIQSLRPNNKKDTAIVSSLLHLAKGLQMKVVAEGVEEYEQLEFLKQNECDMIQGYIYSQPVPADKFEQMMLKRYLQPTKQKQITKPKIERRKYFRFVFPGYLLTKMKITEINQRKVNANPANILIENISLGGIKFFSPLKLPINTNIKLNFQFDLMGRTFDLNGVLVWVNEEKSGVNCYGVSFNITEGEKDELAEIINKMTLLTKNGEEIPEINLINESPYMYLRKSL